MNIKSRLLLLLGIPFILSVIISFVFIVYMTSDKVGIQLKQQLRSQDDAIVRQVSEQVRTAARSYLTAVGDMSNKTVSRIYNQISSGNLTREQVTAQAQSMLLGEKFIGNGYIYVVDEEGKILFHPDKNRIGKDSIAKEWLKTLEEDESGYFNYELNGRDKVLYKVHNEDLHWNLMITANTDDFFKSLDLEELNKTMNEIKVGDKGYPLLLSEDGIILSHENPDLIGVSGLDITDYDGNKIVQRIMKEKEGDFYYRWKEPDGSVTEKFIYYKYEKNSKLYVCTTGYKDDFYFIVTSLLNIIIISGLIMAGTMILMLFLVAISISKPVKFFTTSMRDISEGEGDLTNRINIKTTGEIGIMVECFNRFLNTLQNLIVKIKEASVQTISIKEHVSHGVDETAAALHEISTNIQEIKKQTNHLNTNVQGSARASDEIRSSADDLDESVEKQSIMLETSTAAITEMISSIESVDAITVSKKQSAAQLLQSAKSGSQDMNDTQNAVKEVNSQLDNIQEMAHVITAIASRTNLLAMNAAIEAAHAGDAGKGFAVVADEIRKLAENSSTNSARITETLKEISQSIISADMLSEKAMKSFTILYREITDIADALTEITSSTNELKIGGKDILRSISGLEEASHSVRERALQIKEMSEKVKSSMEDTSNISLEVVTSIDEINQGVVGINESMATVTDNTFLLKETSDNLKNNVNRFKV